MWSRTIGPLCERGLEPGGADGLLQQHLRRDGDESGKASVDSIARYETS